MVMHEGTMVMHEGKAMVKRCRATETCSSAALGGGGWRGMSRCGGGG